MFFFHILTETYFNIYTYIYIYILIYICICECVYVISSLNQTKVRMHCKYNYTKYNDIITNI